LDFDLDLVQVREQVLVVQVREQVLVVLLQVQPLLEQD
jgi:hypothetical protein